MRDSSGYQVLDARIDQEEFSVEYSAPNVRLFKERLMFEIIHLVMRKMSLLAQSIQFRAGFFEYSDCADSYPRSKINRKLEFKNRGDSLSEHFVTIRTIQFHLQGSNSSLFHSNQPLHLLRFLWEFDGWKYSYNGGKNLSLDEETEQCS